MNKERNIANLPLDGGLLCLDFVNTVQTRKKDGAHEYLPNYAAFLQWCIKLNVTSPKEVKEFEKIVAQSPAAAVTAYHHIIIARELLYKLFSANAGGQPVEKNVLERFNELLAEALQHLGFKDTGEGLQECWLNPDTDIAAPLWKVMKSAYDILNAPGAKYVKECPACGWMFLDKSRTHTRRWCNPLECGSIDKATRYYHRQKAKKSGA